MTVTKDETANDGVRDRLRAGLERFGERLQEEARGVEHRIKQGIQSAVEDSKHPERRFGRPPKRRPPSGRPPSVS